MTTSRNIKYFLLFCVLLINSACKDVFEDINVENQNQPKQRI